MPHPVRDEGPATGSIAVISDTHMPKGDRSLPSACVVRLRAAELIIHAGDWSSAKVLEELEALGPPVRGVHGNVEERAIRERLPERLELDWRGHRIGVVHDSGPRAGRLRRLRRAFPEAELVVFGHSHLPLIERDPEGFQILNPGSPTERRRAPARSMGLVEIGGEGSLIPRLIDIS